MNLEDQVVSLELSKRLKELGIQQESLFYWYYYQEEDKFVDYRNSIVVNIEHFEDPTILYSAFTASELFQLIPAEYQIDKIKVNYFNGKYCDEYFIHHEGDGIDSKECISNENLCESLAKMLIHLIENNLIGIK